MGNIEDKALSELITAVIDYVKRFTKKLHYDITERGHILEVLDNGKYRVRTKNSEKVIPSALNTDLVKMDTVYVTYPSGNRVDAFISFKINNKHQ